MDKIVNVVTACACLGMDESKISSQFSGDSSEPDHLRACHHVYCVSSSLASSMDRREIDLLTSYLSLNRDGLEGDDEVLWSIFSLDKKCDLVFEYCIEDVYRFLSLLIASLRSVNSPLEYTVRKLGRIITIVRSGFGDVFRKDAVSSSRNMEHHIILLNERNYCLSSPIFSVVMDPTLEEHWVSIHDLLDKQVGTSMIEFFLCKSKKSNQIELIFILLEGCSVAKNLSYLKSEEFVDWLKKVFLNRDPGDRLSIHSQIFLSMVSYYSCYDKDIALTLDIDPCNWCLLIDPNTDHPIWLYVYLSVMFEHVFHARICGDNSTRLTFDLDDLEIRSDNCSFLVDFVKSNQPSQGETRHELLTVSFWRDSLVNLETSIEKHLDKVSEETRYEVYSKCYSEIFRTMKTLRKTTCNQYFHPLTYFNLSKKDILLTSPEDAIFLEEERYDWKYKK